MALFTQQDRLLAIDTPLGSDVLLLTRLKGQENISALYSFEVELYSASTQIEADKIVGENVTLKIMQADTLGFRSGGYRHINGYVRRFRGEGEQLQGLRRYTAEVVPWLWFLTQTSDSKIFQNKDIKQIATEIFSENGFTDFEFRLIGQHPIKEYCVQYQESDFTFLSRLFEEEGIFYYFRHEDGKHTLIIADHNGAYETCQEGSVSYQAGSLSAHSIHAWSHQYEFRTGRYAKRDYDFKKPSDRLQTGVATDMPLNGVKRYEHFIYPGRYEDKSFGDQLTRLRVEQDEASHDQVKGEGGCRSFTPGHSFTLNRHDDAPEEMDDYLLLGVDHQASDYSYTSQDDVEREYKNTFRAMPTSRVYRPAMITGWPKMQGPQNAMVVGPAGEEIYTDPYGRVKIQFPWDRYGQYNENSSCWVRMSNNWAGKNWGGVFIPRIGQEVIVDFYDGNPDRPIITGRVYNAEQMPPNTLPAQKTRMTLRSDTHKGEGFNELTFEDEAGEEQIYLHAQKDHNTVILNDETHQIGRDRAKSVGQNQSERIGNDKKINVGNDHTETIGNDGRYSIGRDVHYDVARTQHENYGKDHIEQVGNILKQDIYANHLYQVGRNYEGQVNGTYKLDVGSKITTNTGVHDLQAYEKFIISGPSGKIIIDGSGITLEAPNIRLKGAVSMGGSGGAQVPTLNLAANEILPICEECEKKKR